jgi:DNA-binding transcriptional ArsR family regulator
VNRRSTRRRRRSLRRQPSTDVFLAISDPRRRALLDLLRKEERSVSSLVDEFDVSFPAISQHLRVLKLAGLVVARAEGRSRVYSATPGPLEQVHDWTEQYRAFWQGRFRKLNEYLSRQP